MRGLCKNGPGGARELRKRGWNMRKVGLFLILTALGAGCASDKGNEIQFDHKAVLKEMQVEDLGSGTGTAAELGDRLTVRYVGKFEDGKVFDSSEQTGQDFSFHLGKREVIPAWDAGLVGMKAGGKRKLIVPPQLAYGARGFGSRIPPNKVLIYEVELIKISQD